ncbi:MAG: peptidoglycan-binding protein [Leptolyngbya sp. BL-A-14]
MGKTQAGSSKPQTLKHWLFCRVAFSLLGLSLGMTALHITTEGALSQTGAATTGIGKAPTDPLLRPTLKLGSRGAVVTELQATLQLLGYYSGTVDGVYGQTTVSAVSQFQQAAGLNADGVTGPATWNRLFPAASEVAETSPTMTNGTAASTTSRFPAPSGTTSSAASFPVPAGVSSPPSTNQPTTQPRPTTKPAPTTSTPKPGTTSKPGKPSSAPASAPNTTPSQTSTSVALPVLKQGTRGPAVVALQERLRSLGFFKGAADGVFGAETLTAVKAAQRSFKLEPDGVVGAGTWSALLR